MAILFNCSCGRRLSVSDSYAGRTVGCACGRKLVVPEPELRLAPLEAPTREREELARELWGREVAPPKMRVGQCPACGVGVPMGAAACPGCGSVFRSADGSARRAIPWNYVGPAAAAVLLAAVGIAWGLGLFDDLARYFSPGYRTLEERAVERRRPPPAPLPAFENVEVSAARFTGGDVRGRIELADASAPYSIARRLAVHRRGYLRIGAGVSLVGREGATLDVLPGGRLVVDGSPDSPVVIAMPLSVSGEGAELRGVSALAAGPARISGASHVDLANFAFLAVSSAGGAAEAAWRLSHCELHPAGGTAVCLDVDLADPSRAVALEVADSNVLGAVAGRAERPSALSLGRSYWVVPAARSTKGLSGTARPVLEPVGPRVVETAGVGDQAAVEALLARAGVPPAPEGRVLASPRLGFELRAPAGWRPAGGTLAVSPQALGYSRIEVARHDGQKLPVRLRLSIVDDMRRQGAGSVEATDGEVIALGLGPSRVECLTFGVAFESGGAAMRKVFVLVPASECIFSVALSGPAAHVSRLEGAFLSETVGSLRILGE
jgi:hypothetical protein